MSPSGLKNLVSPIALSSPTFSRGDFETEIRLSLNYLGSEAALQSIETDPYWPKWNSPWWHMVLLHEMGETQKIPANSIEKMISALNNYPLKIFPLRQEEMPTELDPYRHTSCHCALGNIYQVLSSWGVNVDEELPWIRPWFLRYQMLDGGLSCDNEAYLVKDECPSSMVGTIAPFEAILLHTNRPWNPEETAFLGRAANFLIERKLTHGSNTKYNADERDDEEKWLKPCFPRFYLYDVLRGLNALLLWSEKAHEKISIASIRGAVTHMANTFPDGKVLCQRNSYENVTTIQLAPSGEWIRRQPATFFPLLVKTSAIGKASPQLSGQWIASAQRIIRLLDEGLLS